MSSSKMPTILSTEIVAESKLFTIESLNLRFSNGELRCYERMKPQGHHAVMVVPITAQNDILLIREYSAGTECYELGFPKGAVDRDETAAQAANRELKEEIGFGTHSLIPLKDVVLAPSHFSSRMTLFLAQDLYPESLIGDEPEPLELVRWPLMQAEELLTHADFRESRSIAALMLALRYLRNDAMSKLKD